MTARPRWTTWWGRTALVLGLGGLGVAGASFAVAAVQAPSTAQVARLAEEAPRRTSYMQQAVLEERLDAEHALEWVDLNDLSPRVLCAVVMAEDPIFFRHHGFNYGLMLSALVSQLQGRTIGSSTLSQQLARNLYLGPEQTLSRKLREAVIAERLEETLGKRRILELYINVAEWGPRVWGLAQASQHYWGKPPTQLTVFEAVFLASLLPAPSRPLVDDNLERSAFIQRIVLDVLHGATVINADEWRLSHQRLEGIYRALHASMPLHEALALPVEDALALPPGPAQSQPDMSSLQPSPPIPEEQLLAEQCGLERAEAHFGPF
ncbi:biosynthetic peptidoglycan transglycosylase [Corallococcus sp. EGB]|uniref:biosynthetic peptidoglycan transglycosylase n=1 Tax=Corallococcus sp. EGB TaxID=1521117 RepID=UPI001CBE7460|nr:biosynthetic peptidoglycan transglycosylase [Corallococcus sp. EGB]